MIIFLHILFRYALFLCSGVVVYLVFRYGGVPCVQVWWCTLCSGRVVC